MPTIRLILQYDGSHYAGWQRQTSRSASGKDKRAFKTVQEELEKALSRVVGHKVHTESSGRTDSGVHAVAQPVHFLTSSRIPAEGVKNAVNKILPRDMAVLSAEQADCSFHARFCARSKIYQYVILSRCERSVFLQKKVWPVKYALSPALMRKAASVLVGRHDFSSFQSSDRKARKAVTEIKKIRIRVSRDKDILPFLRGVELLTIEIEATGFLRGMVRNIVGTLVEFGRGKRPVKEMKNILEKRNRQAADRCAPAEGLYLTEVFYD